MRKDPPASSFDERAAGPLSVQPDVDLDGNSPTVGNKLSVGFRLEEYEISGVIGEGGFGIVYIAWDHSLQRRLAIKEYMPASLAWRRVGVPVEVRAPEHAESFEGGLRSFINEAKLLARFDHASLLKVYRFWQANGTAYMVMPYYEGPTLKQALAAMGRPPDEAWLRGILAPLLDALEYLHSASCYHRDIAPDNILLIDGGRPLLLDFGAARRLIGDMSKSATVILKSGYAPIEQYGEIPGLSQGAWTDIYALGAVLHFAITGKVPLPSVSRLIRGEEVPLAQSQASRFSPSLLHTVDCMLGVQPGERPQTIAEVRALLDPGTQRQGPPAAMPAASSTASSTSGVAPRPLTEPPTARARPPSSIPVPGPVPSARHGAVDAARAGAVRTPEDAGRQSTGAVMAGLVALVALAAVGAWWGMRASAPVVVVPSGLDTSAASAPAPTQGVTPPGVAPHVNAPGPSASVVQPGIAPMEPMTASSAADVSAQQGVPTSAGLVVPGPAAVVVPALPASRTAPAPALAPTPTPTPTPALVSAPRAARGAPPLTSEPANVPAADAAKPRMSARCLEIVQRISIGEMLTAAERAVLKEECKR